jgi:hypothetical protein
MRAVQTSGTSPAAYQPSLSGQRPDFLLTELERDPDQPAEPQVSANGLLDLVDKRPRPLSAFAVIAIDAVADLQRERVRAPERRARPADLRHSGCRTTGPSKKIISSWRSSFSVGSPQVIATVLRAGGGRCEDRLLRGGTVEAAIQTSCTPTP